MYDLNGLTRLDMDRLYLTSLCGMSLARPHRKSTTARGWTDIPIPFGRVHIRAGAVTSTRRWGLWREDFAEVVHQCGSTCFNGRVSGLSKEPKSWSCPRFSFLALCSTARIPSWTKTTTTLSPKFSGSAQSCESANATPILSDWSLFDQLVIEILKEKPLF